MNEETDKSNQHQKIQKNTRQALMAPAGTLEKPGPDHP
jgi:hypothetical protein